MKVWYDQEADYQSLFERKEGYFRETENDAVMEKVDTDGNILGSSILRVSTLESGKPLSVTLKSQKRYARVRLIIKSESRNPDLRNSGVKRIEEFQRWLFLPATCSLLPATLPDSLKNISAQILVLYDFAQNIAHVIAVYVDAHPFRSGALKETSESSFSMTVCSLLAPMFSVREFT